MKDGQFIKEMIGSGVISMRGLGIGPRYFWGEHTDNTVGCRGRGQHFFLMARSMDAGNENSIEITLAAQMHCFYAGFLNPCSR